MDSSCKMVSTVSWMARAADSGATRPGRESACSSRQPAGSFASAEMPPGREARSMTRQPVERTEPSGKAAGVERAHAIGLDPGEIPRGTGGNRDGGIQRVQLMGEQRADTPISDDQAGRALQGMLGLFHSEL